ncbi:MAG: hypothetical protein K2O14_14965 [Oscillospiraceae bacterium]|nr:hypothetical protein [Oscillospiraceae bacterium]
MRKQLAIAAVLSALLLTACSGENSSESSENSQSEISSGSDTHEIEAPESSAEAESSAPETAEPIVPPLDPEDLEGIADLDSLYGPDGEKVDKSVLTAITHGFDDEGNPDKTKWFNASTDRFAYYSDPQGFIYNSYDNADLLDKENRMFNVDIPVVTEYKRCAVGDKIGGLTVSYTSSMFGTNIADINFIKEDETMVAGRDLGIPEIFFLGSDIGFDGSVDLSGYIFICPEDEGYDARGDIFFTPDAESCVLPVVNFSFDTEKGIYTRNYMMSHDGEFFFMSDYPSIYAGNIFSSELDFADYPIGEPIKVKLTAADITMRSNINWITQTQFVIADIEKMS